MTTSITLWKVFRGLAVLALLVFSSPALAFDRTCYWSNAKYSPCPGLGPSGSFGITANLTGVANPDKTFTIRAIEVYANSAAFQSGKGEVAASIRIVTQSGNELARFNLERPRSAAILRPPASNESASLFLPDGAVVAVGIGEVMTLEATPIVTMNSGVCPLGVLRGSIELYRTSANCKDQ